MCGLPQKIPVIHSATSHPRYPFATMPTTKLWLTSGVQKGRKLSFRLVVLAWEVHGPEIKITVGTTVLAKTRPKHLPTPLLPLLITRNLTALISITSIVTTLRASKQVDAHNVQLTIQISRLKPSSMTLPPRCEPSSIPSKSQTDTIVVDMKSRMLPWTVT